MNRFNPNLRKTMQRLMRNVYDPSLEWRNKNGTCVLKFDWRIWLFGFSYGIIPSIHHGVGDKFMTVDRPIYGFHLGPFSLLIWGKIIPSDSYGSISPPLH